MFLFNRKKFVGWVQAQLKLGDDPEVAAAAAQSPEELRVLVGARGDEPSVGGHEINGDEVVDGEAMLPHEPTDPSAQRDAATPVAEHWPPVVASPKACVS